MWMQGCVCVRVHRLEGCVGSWIRVGGYMWCGIGIVLAWLWVGQMLLLLRI